MLEHRTAGGEHAALLAFMESIDGRLAALEKKLDKLQTSVVTQGACTVCQNRWIPRTYLAGLTVAGACLGVVAAVIGDLSGIWGGISRLAGK